MDEETRRRCWDYATELYAGESEVHGWIRETLESRDLPLIQITALEGRLLAVLAHAVDARRVLEVGTLGGYSGLWLLSLLAPGARLVTLEKEPTHAEVAREAFRRAGEEARVDLRVGDAGELLSEMARRPPVDFAFIDADKESYPAYLEAVTEMLRPGALVAADNTLWEGRATRPAEEGDAATRGIREFNETLEADDRYEPVLLPLRDGMTVARFRG